MRVCFLKEKDAFPLPNLYTSLASSLDVYKCFFVNSAIQGKIL